MSMYQGLDLSRFKKVSANETTSTLRHSQGHAVKIAHSALSPKMAEHIKNMPVYLADGTEEPLAAPQMPAAAPAPVAAAAPVIAPPAAPAPMVGPPAEPPKPGVRDQLLQEAAMTEEELNNGTIKPETYHDLFAKQDTLGKVGTLFGLLVGGAGAGLTHQPNVVMEMMNKEIQNDLEAQRASATNKYNLHNMARNYLIEKGKQGLESQKIGLEGIKTQTDVQKMINEGKLSEAQGKAYMADAATKTQALDTIKANKIALHSLAMKVQKLPPGSQERLAAERQLAIINDKIQNENYSIADRAEVASALANSVFNTNPPAGPANDGKPINTGAPQASATPQGAPDPEANFQNNNKLLRLNGKEDLAKDAESKHMPGIKGQASVPLTQEDRGNVLAGKQFQDEMSRFMEWTKAHSGDLNPKDRAHGEALAAQLQGAYRQATKGGVYKEGEQGFISHIIDSTPTKFLNEIRVLPKLEAVQQESAAQLDSLLKSKGFEGYEAPKGKHEHEGKIATNPTTGEKKVMKDGKWVPVGQTKQASSK